MSTIRIEAIVSVDDMIKALIANGATVTLPVDEIAPQTHISVTATVDVGEAWRLIPHEWTEDYEGGQPDTRDVADFIDACMSGDRLIATALLPRLNLSDQAIMTSEHLLAHRRHVQ